MTRRGSSPRVQTLTSPGRKRISRSQFPDSQASPRTGAATMEGNKAEVSVVGGNQKRTRRVLPPASTSQRRRLPLPTGVLTGGADVGYFMGSTAGFTIWNRFRAQDKKDDLGWAIGEMVLGTVIAMSLADTVKTETVKDGMTQGFRTTGNPRLLNVALGAAAAGMTYLLNGRAGAK